MNLRLTSKNISEPSNTVILKEYLGEHHMIFGVIAGEILRSEILGLNKNKTMIHVEVA